MISGVQISLWQNGNIADTLVVSNNIPHGPWKSYDGNGRIKELSYFNKGKLEKYQVIYNKEGEIESIREIEKSLRTLVNTSISKVIRNDFNAVYQYLEII